jgi:hypothetical protein
MIIKSKLKIFQLSGLNFRPATSRNGKMWQSTLDTLKLSHKNNKIMFIILYKHYLPKNFKIKKPTAKVKIWNLTNYSTICYRIHSGTMVIWFCKALANKILMYLEGMFLSLIFPSQKGAGIFFYWNAFFLALGEKEKKKEILWCLLACLLAFHQVSK